MKPQDIEIRRTGIESSDAQELILALNAELSARYSEDGSSEHFRLAPEEVAPGRGAFLVGYVSGQPQACGAIRLLDAETAEVKRMYVAPGARRLGLARRVLDALEVEARRLGARSIVLETGPRQPEAIALYSSAGLSPIAPFGEHIRSPSSIFLGKTL
jgi:putative acetyltransferase